MATALRIGGLLHAAARPGTAERAATILEALHAPPRARYPDAAVRIADLERVAAAAASPALAARGPRRPGARSVERYK